MGGCSAYCESRRDVRGAGERVGGRPRVEGCAEWMKGMLVVLPDARYELKSFAVDAERRTSPPTPSSTARTRGKGGPVPPTGKSASTDYVYVMDFADGRSGI